MCAACGPVTLARTGERKDGSPKFRCRKKVYRALCGDTCERCGFVAEHRCQLDVHHKNEDREDNRPENLETLCANCHRLHHFGAETQKAA